MNVASAKVLVVYDILEAATGKAAAELLLQKPNLSSWILGFPTWAAWSCCGR